MNSGLLPQIANPSQAESPDKILARREKSTAVHDPREKSRFRLDEPNDRKAQNMELTPKPKADVEKRDSVKTSERQKLPMKALEAKDRSITTSSSSNDLSQEELKELAALAGASELLKNPPPILAFITGKLEEIEPSSIPSLLSKSPFIKAAIAAEDIDTFLGQKLSISDLGMSLGLEKPFSDSANRLGLSLASSVSMKELFSALGLDASQISTELKLLKDNLQLDGFQPYMERANRLRLQAGSTLANATPYGPQSSVEQLMGPAGQRIYPQDPLALRSMNENLAPTQIDVADPAQTLSLTTENGQTLEKPMPVSPYASSTVSEDSARSHELGAYQPGIADRLNVNKKLSLSTALDRQEGMKGDLDIQFDSKTSQIELDRFHRQFNASERTVLNRGDLEPASGLESLGLETGDQLLDQSIASVTKAKQREFANQATREPRILTKNELIAESNVSQVENLESKFDLNQNIERLMARQIQAPLAEKMMPLSMQKELGSGQSSLSDEGSGAGYFESDKSEQSVELLGQSSISHREAGSFDEQLFIERDLKNISAHTAKKLPELVSEKASMLLKDGGGSVLLDLGHQDGLGHLKLALEVSQESVGMKIMTDSDRVKDILGGEVSRLKEALGAHNLDLKQIEIGTNKDRAYHFNQSFNQQPHFSQDEYRSRREFIESDHPVAPVTKVRSVISAFNNRGMFRHGIPKIHSGQIQILA